MTTVKGSIDLDKTEVESGNQAQKSRVQTGAIQYKLRGGRSERGSSH